MGADADSITMSGFSSGAFMTNIQAIIHSDKIKGIGLLSGGPYGTWIGNYFNPDSKTLEKDSKDLIAKHQDLVTLKKNFKNKPVYIHSGGIFDTIVPPAY